MTPCLDIPESGVELQGPMTTSSSQPSIEMESLVHQGAASETRTASIGKVNGKPIGAPLYFTAVELRELGADLEGDRIVFAVEDGELRIE